MTPHCLQDSFSILVRLVRCFMIWGSDYLFSIFVGQFPLTLSLFSNTTNMCLQLLKYTILSFFCAFVHAVLLFKHSPCPSSPRVYYYLSSKSKIKVLSLSRALPYCPPHPPAALQSELGGPLHSALSSLRSHISSLVHLSYLFPKEPSVKNLAWFLACSKRCCQYLSLEEEFLTCQRKTLSFLFLKLYS